MICPQCRHINEADAKYCKNCGHPFSYTTAPGLSQAPVYGELVPGIDYGDTPDVIDFSKTVPVGPRHADSLVEDVDYIFGSERDDDTQVDLTGLDKLVDSANASGAGASGVGSSVMTVPIEGTKRMPAVSAGGGSSSYRGQVPLPDAPRKKGRGLKIAIVVVLILVALVAGAAAATYYLGMWGGKTVPNVVGEALVNATYTLEDAGFVVVAEERKSDDVEGIVVEMNPAAGSRCDEGTSITVYLSVSRVIPEIIGMEKEVALAAVDAEGFTDVEVTVVKSDESEGTVVSVDPAPGQKAKSGQHINITVAEPYTVPSVDGLTQEEAIAAIEQAGYVAQIAVHYSEDLPEGSIYGTEPVAGTKFNSGSTVVISIVKSRAAECLAFAQSYFTSTEYFEIGGNKYKIEPPTADSFEYRGDSRVGYTLYGVQYETVFGQTIFNEAAGTQTLTGTVTFSESGDNVGSDPELKRAQ